MTSSSALPGRDRVPGSASAPDGPALAEPPVFSYRFPEKAAGLDQDEEWFEVRVGGSWQRLRLHDYAEIYSIPGLYEDLVYKRLRCRSPRRIVRLLGQVLEDWDEDLSDLRVLDLGAGNGIVGERLRQAGVGHVVGLDILPEARESAERDRPGVYDDYIVGDVTRPEADAEGRLSGPRFNTLTSVAALGFGDIPPDAFRAAFGWVTTPGWVAFSIKEDFLAHGEASGFGGFVRRLIDTGVLAVQAQWRFCHRRSLAGEPLFYVGIVARKTREIPPA